MINAMKVGEHGKKWAKKLSGGTKRKVRCGAGINCLLDQELISYCYLPCSSWCSSSFCC